MCGRYTITMTYEQLVVRYFIEEANNSFYLPRYNVAPMQTVPAIISDGRVNRIGPLRWGLVPSWANEESMASRAINAKAETLLERPSFRNLIYKKRCIIPADSFYEWRTIGRGKKQPIRFMRRDQAIFSMAGLYDQWIRPSDGVKISTFTIITTTPNAMVAEVHDRMPVILQQEDELRWLDRSNTDTQALLSLLRPFPAQEMMSYPVASLVGSVSQDSPACIERVPPIAPKEEPVQISWFEEL